jgi:hypothetical protein
VVCWRSHSKWILKKSVGRSWTGLIWVRTGTSGGLFLTRRSYISTYILYDVKLHWPYVRVGIFADLSYGFRGDICRDIIYCTPEIHSNISFPGFRKMRTFLNRSEPERNEVQCNLVITTPVYATARTLCQVFCSTK